MIKKAIWNKFVVRVLKELPETCDECNQEIGKKKVYAEIKLSKKDGIAENKRMDEIKEEIMKDIGSNPKKWEGISGYPYLDRDYTGKLLVLIKDLKKIKK